jgi:hypothetical protein
MGGREPGFVLDFGTLVHELQKTGEMHWDGWSGWVSALTEGHFVFFYRSICSGTRIR